MTLTRKKVAIAAALLLIIPAFGWWVLFTLGYVSAPGEALEPPFDLSDRIVTIDVVGEEGEYKARFDGWEEGDPEMTADEFFEELRRRKEGMTPYHELPDVFGLLDVTSPTGAIWVLFGFLAQAVFMARLIVQWYASEKAQSSVIPTAFWWLSLLGSSMLMVYFIWRKEPVGFVGQSTGWFIYLRNLWFIYGKKDRLDGEEEN